MFRIQEVPGSNLDPEIHYPDSFGFLQSLQSAVRVILRTEKITVLRDVAHCLVQIADV